MSTHASIDALDSAALNAFIKLGRRPEWWCDWLPPSVDVGILKSLDNRGLVHAQGRSRSNKHELLPLGFASPNRNPSAVGTWDVVLGRHLVVGSREAYSLALTPDGAGVWGELARAGRVPAVKPTGCLASTNSAADDLLSFLDGVLEWIEFHHRAEFDEPPFPRPLWWNATWPAFEPDDQERLKPVDVKRKRLNHCNEQLKIALDGCIAKWDKLAECIPAASGPDAALWKGAKRALEQMRFQLFVGGRELMHYSVIPHSRHLARAEPQVWHPEPVSDRERRLVERDDRLLSICVFKELPKSHSLWRRHQAAVDEAAELERGREERNQERSVDRVTPERLEKFRRLKADWGEVVERWGLQYRTVVVFRELLVMAPGRPPPMDREEKNGNLPPDDLHPATFYSAAVDEYHSTGEKFDPQMLRRARRAGKIAAVQSPGGVYLFRVADVVCLPGCSKFAHAFYSALEAHPPIPAKTRKKRRSE